MASPGAVGQVAKLAASFLAQPGSFGPRVAVNPRLDRSGDGEPDP